MTIGHHTHRASNPALFAREGAQATGLVGPINQNVSFSHPRASACVSGQKRLLFVQRRASPKRLLYLTRLHSRLSPRALFQERVDYTRVCRAVAFHPFLSSTIRSQSNGRGVIGIDLSKVTLRLLVAKVDNRRVRAQPLAARAHHGDRGR